MTNGDMMYKVSGNVVIKNLFNSLESELKNNTFIISNSLYAQYKKISKPFKELKNDMDIASENFYNFHKNNKVEIKIFLQLIDDEIKEIKNQIGFN